MAKSCSFRAMLAGTLLLAALAGCSLEGPTGNDLDVAIVEPFKRAHARVYEVYDLGPRRDALFDLLEYSFAGPALTREYVEHFTTLHRMEHEKTAIRVLRVDYDRIEVSPLGEGRWLADADWSVGGLVFHRGHSHMRVNRYGALYTLEGQGDSLRIVETKMRDVRRVRSAFEGAEGSLFDARSDNAGGFLSLGELLRGGVELPDPEADEDGSSEDAP